MRIMVESSGRLERSKFDSNSMGDCSEHYEVDGRFAIRKVTLPEGKKIETRLLLDLNTPEKEDAQSIFDYSYLRLKVRPQVNFLDEVKTVDLFSGCGCLSLGAFEACNAIGKRFVPMLAIDKDSNAIAVYEENFKPIKTYSEDICTLIDGNLESKPTANELRLQKDYLNNSVPTLLLAGPPCQGYSSLNNFHRQKDDRNKLYERVARFVELYSPENVIIENIPAVTQSPDKVVEKTIHLMESKNYLVDSQIVNLVDIGVPQVRKRHVVVGSKRKKILIADTIKKHKVSARRTFEWAAGDLQDEPAFSLLSTPTKHSDENKKRMEYLHKNKEYTLPNSERPICHQKDHGYKSMYGRIKADAPTQTITSGFTSPGQGRFTHPTKVRTITPHEAARLQFIPDFFSFSKCATRNRLSLMIGNAVPMRLSYVFCLELLA
jgi:DNA (cytosine-5)-methyltransferase 1